MIDALSETLPVLTLAEALAITDGSAVVVLADWTPREAAALARHASRTDVLHLPIRFDGALVLVGPVLRRGVTGCLHCAEKQRLTTARTPRHDPDLLLGGLPSPALLDGIAALAESILLTPEPGVVWTLHGGRGTWSRHEIRPVGGCDVCAPLPDDEPERFALEPRPLPDPSVLRQPNPRTSLENLRETLHDPVFGPVQHVYRTEDSVFGLTSALIARGLPLPEGGFGRGADFHGSERVALLEALERYAGAQPTGRRTALRASFAELGPDKALDPERLGLPDPAYHGHPSAPTVPYHPDLELAWVHGWSLSRDRSVAVPEHVAYWDPPGSARVVYECSNGCGLGNSPEEAALYGLFEIAERDAFLMAWYQRKPLPPVRIPGDLVTSTLVGRAAELGYRVTVVNATNDFGIPAMVAIARYEGADQDAPQAFIAAGAHHDPATAVRSAISELVSNVGYVTRRATAEPGWRDLDRLRRMFTEPELVLTLDDHVGVNTLPEALPRIEALIADLPEAALAEAPPVHDLTDLLRTTVDRLDLEVVVVRLDEPGARDRLGLSCVKVIVPGSIPMTFGHVNHRTRGLPRLGGDLFVDPHPFP
ncbi:ribosomal protein S12 methylthiotransferase accessory factor [Amycolatopsis xylanica]|uniref:Ribosomal protein S12 methylthiotransferase accessory factor n=1 Tax=Amycolatopsis xylanica TaxID=589385 RepID=A0A1H3PAX8_9PSEU|nr:TOMM precursor leader peptide-binding protein [Amycolatopsis xylanica]SDY97549.1 ribosomal protein S12 methylthiotransferase accessory factor [Amycolatopsis xylanica]